MQFEINYRRSLGKYTEIGAGDMWIMLNTS